MRRTLILVSLAVLVIVACRQRPSPPSMPSTPAGPSLSGDWLLTHISGDPLPANTPITFLIAHESSFSGTGPCNRFTGRLRWYPATRTLELSHLAYANLAVALPNCLSPTGADLSGDEARYSALLHTGPFAVTQSASTLTLTNPNGDTLQFTRRP